MHRADRSLRPAALALVALVAAAPASAQSSPTIALLHRSFDAGARARAAEALGRIGPMGARAALESALNDRSPVVRLASAQALEALGDPSATAALNHHALDHDAGTREAIMHALHALMARMPRHCAGAWSATAGANTAAVAPAAPAGASRPGPRVDWRNVRVVFSLGPFANNVSVDAGHIAHLHEALRVAVSEDARYAIHPGVLPPAATARLRRGALRSFSLEGALTSLRETGTAASLSVRAEVSLMLVSEPARSITATLDGSATAQASPPAIPDLPDPMPRLRQRAIEGAAHGALRSLEDELLASGRRASR